MRQGLCNGTVSVRLSVCLTRLSTAAAACGGFAAVAAAIDRYLLPAGRRSTAHSSTACRSEGEQCHVVS